MSNTSIWPIDRTLSDATTPGQSGLRSNGNEGVLQIPQSSKPGASLSDCLVSYPSHLLAGFYPSVEMQSVYSLTPANLARERRLDIYILGGASGVLVIIIGNRLVALSANPWCDCLHFILYWYPWERYKSIYKR